MLPKLRERGVTDDQIEQIMVRNPRDFFAQQGTYVGAQAQAGAAEA